MPAAAFSYQTTQLPIPDRVVQSHRRSWDIIARPGRWWSGAERVAIAAETRRARNLAADLPADDGIDNIPADLPEAATFAVAKIVADNANLSPDWYRETIAAPGLSDGHYVELLSVLVHALSIDEFHRALGLPLEPLPQPQPGEPSGRRPTGAAQNGSWVPTVAPAALDAEDDDIYGPDHRFAANVIMALSLVPENVRWLADLSTGQYLSFSEMRDPRQLRAITRPQIELIAARVSALNECFY